MNQTLFSQTLRPALVLFLLITVLTGFIYPAAVTGIAQALFPFQANGSVIVHDGTPVGSALIGQSFSSPKYFWGRLSATSPMPYNGAASSGSNLSALNPALLDNAKARIDALRAAGSNEGPIPVDLATASGSGLDPQISLAAAQYQVARVAKARGMPEEKIRALLAANTQTPELGFLGEARVNVLQLNLALDGAR